MYSHTNNKAHWNLCSMLHKMSPTDQSSPCFTKFIWFNNDWLIVMRQTLINRMLEHISNFIQSLSPVNYKKKIKDKNNTDSVGTLIICNDLKYLP